jgi:peptidyl-prolyl cis-trans isomerase B (cyclophilin B)
VTIQGWVKILANERAGDVVMTKTRIPQAAIAVLTAGTLFLASCACQAPGATPEPTAKPKTYSAPPAMVIDTGKEYVATIETERGDMVLELFASDVPNTVNNFVFLANDGFYDGTTFHRVVPDFVVQGGDPTGTGRGNPGYSFADEFSEHTHLAGALSMANSGTDTNGCQFFITLTPQHGLDGKHSVFGQLIDGMDVLQQIEQGDVIIRITIEEK